MDGYLPSAVLATIWLVPQLKSAMTADPAFEIPTCALAGLVTPDMVNWINESAGKGEVGLVVSDDVKATVRTLDKIVAVFADAPVGAPEVKSTLQGVQVGFPESVIMNFDVEGSAHIG